MLELCHSVATESKQIARVTVAVTVQSGALFAPVYDTFFYTDIVHQLHGHLYALS